LGWDGKGDRERKREREKVEEGGIGGFPVFSGFSEKFWGFFVLCKWGGVGRV
jgi:hypothetical protein